MSNLRIAGIILGLVGIIFILFWYRGVKWKKNLFLTLFLINFCLILISIKPESVNLLRDILFLHSSQYGRILALIILSNIFLAFFLFYTKAKHDDLNYKFDKLLRYISIYNIQLNIDEIKKKLKPIMVVVPAYNEENNLIKLLPSIPNRIYNEEIGVIVVDDGSDDGTYELSSKNPKVISIKSPINRGGGTALKIGFDLVKLSNCKICITMDADCQHNPAEIEKLIRPIIYEKYDIVIGSRVLGSWEGNFSIRHFGVYFFSFVINVLLGKKITDPSSGFRAFKIEMINKLYLEEHQYHTSEFIIEAIKKDLRIKEVPISMMLRNHGDSKKGRNIIYGFHFARSIIKSWWR